MAVQTACPPAGEFEQLLKHGSSAAQNERLLEHLESCPHCWETIAPLLESDTLLSGVALSRPNAAPELVGRLMALKTSDATREFGAMSITPVDGACDATDDPPAPTVIGHYQFFRLLGRGGMGAVYLATDTRLNRQVALKLMLPRFAARASAKERFLREARAAAQIANDNVVTIYEADERDGIPYIAMQFLQGATLEEHLKKNETFSVDRILRIAAETASGLAAAHALGLIHRDIKPANLWLEAPGGRVKVLDFGLAKPFDTEVELTGSGTLVGTPAFISPEQGRGKKVDARTDLFSLGVVLYRLCTGRLPFDGPNTLAILTSLGIDEPPPVRRLNPEVPETLAKLIHDLLAKSPENRPRSAAEVVERVHKITKISTDPGRQKPRGISPGIAAGFAALVMFVALGIIIIIKNKDGSETKIDVADGASVTIKDQHGKTLAAVANIKDSDWEKQIAGMKAEDQVAAVAARLKLLNPRFLENNMTHRIEKDVVILVVIDATEVANLAPLRALTGLKDIYLSGNFRNPADISALKGLKLTSFQTNGCPLKDLSPLAGMPLTRANFWGNATADLSPLRGMKLVETNVGHSPAKDISVFKGMPLETVCLNHCHVEDLSPLIGAPLKKLEADNIKATDLTPLTNMPLEVLHLKGTPIKDYSVLRTLPLTTLALNFDPKLHAELLRAIPTLKTINDRPAADVLNGVSELPDREAAAWVLSIGGVVKVTGQDQVIKSAAQLPKDGYALTAVIFFRNREVTDSGLARLAKLTNLQELVLYHTPITDVGLVHLKELKNLTRLDLGETRVTDAGLAVIKGLTKLTSLSLHYTAVSGPWLDNLKTYENLASLNLNGAVNDAGLERLVPCKSIKELMLVNTPITDAGLAVLKNLPGLTRIDVQNTKVTARGLADFHAAVPGCKIEHNGGVIEAKK